MKKNKLIYALIPARKVSKSIKNKNLKKIGNKSLIENSIIVAKKSDKINKTFCSTDNKKILSICSKMGVIGIKRPKKISGGNSKVIETVYHFIEYLKKNKIDLPEILILLQPTSPFIFKEDINELINCYKKKSNISSVNSYIEVSHKYNPVNLASLSISNKVNYLNYQQRISKPMRQQKKNYYVHGNLFSFRLKEMLKQKNLIPKPIYGIILQNKFKALDIDDSNDLMLARLISKSNIF